MNGALSDSLGKFYNKITPVMSLHSVLHCTYISYYRAVQFYMRQRKLNILSQRCQLLRITRSHYGKFQKFSVIYGLRKTRIFLQEFFKNVVIRNVAKKALNKRL